jgi:ElaA protein
VNPEAAPAASLEALQWTCEPFDALRPAILYAMLRLRSEVFVLEQQCVFLDPDGLDLVALHLGAWQQGVLQAYARLLPPGVKAPAPVISRVITAPSARGVGLGHPLAAHAVQACEQQWPGLGITLFAQAHLQAFYGRAGFVGLGEPFMEDGILHREMHRRAGA